MKKIRIKAPVKFGAIPIVVLVALIGGLAMYASFTTYVRPNQVAVRQVYFGPNKGVQAKHLTAGLHLVIPGYERIHVFPQELQLLEFNDGLSAAQEAHVRPSIRIQTSEGYQVTVDVTITYRIVDPYKVITAIGPGSLYETSLMMPRSDKYLRQKLGELNAEQFYQADLRIEKGKAVKDLLEADVGQAGLEVWTVMVRHYKYDQRYQEAIEQRKIQDQTVFKNRAEATAASREAEKNRVLAEGQALVDVEGEKGRADVMKIAAEADLYYRQRIAEGDLLVALAEAEGVRLENRALQVSGAGNMVGLEMAKVLQGSQVIMVPTDGAGAVNPLNLDSLIGGW